MKLAIERAELLKALGHVQSVVERRNTIPILSNVLMTASDGDLRLTATDLDIEIVEGAKADVGQPGEITAPAHTLYDIARKLPDGAKVSISKTSDDRLEVEAGRSHFTLPLLPAGDFPQMTADGFSHEFDVASGALARLIDKTRFAISTEETRYYLNGIYLHGHGAKLRAVATDGHRLALAEMDAPGGADGMPGVIVPRKTVAELRRLIDGMDGEISVKVSESKIRFEMDGMVLTSKLIDGNFPDYDRVIPKNNTKELTLDNKVFASAVDRVATISMEKSKSIKMTLDGDNLNLTVNNPEAGQAAEDLMVGYGGDALEIGFNAKYLMDVAGQIEGRDATYFLNDPASPALVKDSEDPDSLFVLMPLRV
jgi:DNA polymerase-3 subunit beta